MYPHPQHHRLCPLSLPRHEEPFPPLPTSSYFLQLSDPQGLPAAPFPPQPCTHSPRLSSSVTTPRPHAGPTPAHIAPGFPGCASSSQEARDLLSPWKQKKQFCSSLSLTASWGFTQPHCLLGLCPGTLPNSSGSISSGSELPNSDPEEISH